VVLGLCLELIENSGSELHDMFTRTYGILYQQNSQVYALCPRNKCEKLFMSELCQISTNFNSLWHKDGTELEIM